MGILLSIIFGFAPMLFFAYLVYWIDRYEKEPRILLLGVFLWGAVVAAGAAFVLNTLLGMGVYLFTRNDLATELTTGSLIAPVVEESLKGIAILLVYLVFRNEFDSILDGFVYAAVVALGFAATENVFYLYTYGWEENRMAGLIFMVIIRVFMVGWQHPFYTSFTGIGLAITRISRSQLLKMIAPLIGLSLAIFTHAVHNTVASLASGLEGMIFGTALDWMGWFSMFLVVIWALFREQKFLHLHLQEEAEIGLITAQQYQTACSAWSQSGARVGALFNGRYRETQRFYQVCGELAHKKHQRSQLGEEVGNSLIIQNLRTELGQLSSRV